MYTTIAGMMIPVIIFSHLLSSANIRNIFKLCAFCVFFVLFFSAVPFHLLNEGHPYSQAGQRAVVGDVIVSPDAQDGAEKDDGQQEVVEHAAGHDQKALPGRFGAELPGLRVLFQLLRVHRLVHHAGNLAVAAEGQPADTVLRISYLLGKELDPAHIEKEEKLVHLDMEKARPEKMPGLVDEDEDGQGQVRRVLQNPRRW